MQTDINTPMAVSPRRAHSLDALRGYAIMTMILAATEAFGILPAWMYHAQEPPPTHVFNPHIYGITWVDLIFPFFLFSMGAAIPLSLGRQLEKGASRLSLLKKTVIRWMKLTFFAIFVIHVYPYMLGYPAPWMNELVALVAFALMFMMFMRNPFHLGKWGNRTVNTLAYAAAIALILFQPYAEGKPFMLKDEDIIMLILANVSLTGAVIYLITPHKPLARLALIPLLMAFFMSAKADGSWQQAVRDFTFAPWLYHIAYQEYLLIIIPGMVAGDLMTSWLKAEDTAQVHGRLKTAPWVALISLALIVTNVACLYSRLLVLNLVLTAALSAGLWWLVRGKDRERTYWRKLCLCGLYMLATGLLIEAYEGGIRKDDVTLSYLFVTGGLAFFGLLFFTVTCDHYHIRWLSEPLELVGRNPMAAYVSNGLAVIPLLQLCHVFPIITGFCTTPLLGFLQGVVLTALCMLLTAFFTKRRMYWKT